MRYSKINLRTVIVVSTTLAVLLFPSLLATVAEGEGTLGSSLILNFLAGYYPVYTFPVHLLFDLEIGTVSRTTYFIGLLINCLYYGFMIELLIYLVKRKKIEA